MFMNMLNKTLIICQAVIFNWYGGWLRWKEEKYKCDDFQDSVFREEGCEESIKKARRIANLARYNHDVDRFVGEEICVDVDTP